MGMTLWVHILNGRRIESDQNDHSWLHRLQEPLDVLCERDGVEKLSSFFDYTDLEHNMSEVGDGEPALDPETGWAWGIDDMEWFPAASGLKTLRQLQTRIAEADTIGDLPQARKGELIAEVEDCIRQLEPAANGGLRFHFTVVM